MLCMCKHMLHDRNGDDPTQRLHNHLHTFVKTSERGGVHLHVRASLEPVPSTRVKDETLTDDTKKALALSLLLHRRPRSYTALLGC